MKIGLIPVNIGVPRIEPMLALAEKAEQVGIESLWTFEHVVVPIDYKSKYPYSAEGKMAVTPETNFVDPLARLRSRRAQRVRLGTRVNILSQANPLYLAKRAASPTSSRTDASCSVSASAGCAGSSTRSACPSSAAVRAGDPWRDAQVVERRGAHGQFLRWSGFKSHRCRCSAPAYRS
jgi:hypothetical protein